jgi:hypothetical protein
MGELTAATLIDDELLADAIDSLERVECQFWACGGPTLSPEPMKTCHRCDVLARLRVAAGQDPEGPS